MNKVSPTTSPLRYFTALESFKSPDVVLMYIASLWEQSFPVVLYRTLYKIVLGFESEDGILKCDCS